MPLDTLVPLTAIIAVFGFFAAVLIFGDATWSRGAKLSHNSDRSSNRR